MITPRLESGENLFEVLREKFNALAEAVDSLDKLASASPLLDVVDTGAGKLIRWNGPEPEDAGAAPAKTVATARYAGAFAVEAVGGTAARIFNAATPIGEYAGEITIGSTHRNISVGTVPITPGQAAVVYLTVYWNPVTSALVCAFATSLTNLVTGAQGWYRKLAVVSSAGNVTQIHLSGNIEIGGRWCD